MRIKIFSTILIAFFVFLGCGGGSNKDQTQTPQQRSYKVQLNDDYLDNAVVKDSNNQQATYEGRGIYAFKDKPQGTITLQGGTFENTNIPNKMVMEIDASWKKLSAIDTLFYKYPHLKEKVLTALHAKVTDYTINKNIALFRTSKIIYIMASNNLLNSFASSLKDFSNYNDILNIARDASKASPRAAIINAYLAAATLSFFDVSEYSYMPNITQEVELLITKTYPEENETNIATNTQLSVTFNKPIKSSSITNQITLKETNSNDTVGITTTTNRQIITIVPNASLKNETQYTLTLSTSIQSEDNKTLKAPINLAFTTAAFVDTEKPKIIQTNIQNNETLEYGQKISIEFSEVVDEATLNDGIIITQIENTGTRHRLDLDFSFSNDDKNVTIDNFLYENSLYNYELNITSDIKDLAQNPLENPNNVTFKIKQDRTAPKILSITPSNGATQVNNDTNITIIFDEPVDEYSAERHTTIKRDVDGKKFTYTKSFNDNKTIMTLIPTNLANNSKYTLTIDADLEDTSGNELGTTKTSTFSVGTPDTAKPTVKEALGETTTAAGASSLTSLDEPSANFLASGNSIKIKFSEPIDPNSLKSNSIYIKDVSGTPVTIQSDVSTCTNDCTSSVYLSPSDNYYTIGLHLANGNYTLVIDKDIKDLAGNSLASDYTQKFQVGTFSLTTNQTDAGFDLNFTRKTTINVGDITLVATSPNNTSSNIGLNLQPNFGVASKNFRLSPNTNLTGSTSYRLTISGSIQDQAGNALGSDIVRDFTTVQ